MIPFNSKLGDFDPEDLDPDYEFEEKVDFTESDALKEAQEIGEEAAQDFVISEDIGSDAPNVESGSFYEVSDQALLEEAMPAEKSLQRELADKEIIEKYNDFQTDVDVQRYLKDKQNKNIDIKKAGQIKKRYDASLNRAAQQEKVKLTVPSETQQNKVLFAKEQELDVLKKQLDSFGEITPKTQTPLLKKGQERFKKQRLAAELTQGPGKQIKTAPDERLLRENIKISEANKQLKAEGKPTKPLKRYTTEPFLLKDKLLQDMGTKGIYQDPAVSKDYLQNEINRVQNDIAVLKSEMGEALEVGAAKLRLQQVTPIKNKQDLTSFELEKGAEDVSKITSGEYPKVNYVPSERKYILTQPEITYTPETPFQYGKKIDSVGWIDELGTNEVFVFGSNQKGIHGKGAALDAKNKFGAVQGVGEGLTGKSYALPTKSSPNVSLTIDEISKNIDTFLNVASKNPNKVFKMSAIGTNLAKFEPEVIADVLFSKNIPSNVKVPESLQKLKPEYKTQIGKGVIPQSVYSPVKNIVSFEGNYKYGESKTATEKVIGTKPGTEVRIDAPVTEYTYKTGETRLTGIPFESKSIYPARQLVAGGIEKPFDQDIKKYKKMAQELFKDEGLSDSDAVLKAINEGHIGYYDDSGKFVKPKLQVVQPEPIYSNLKGQQEVRRLIGESENEYITRLNRQDAIYREQLANEAIKQEKIKVGGTFDLNDPKKTTWSSYGTKQKDTFMIEAGPTKVEEDVMEARGYPSDVEGTKFGWQESQDINTLKDPRLETMPKTATGKFSTAKNKLNYDSKLIALAHEANAAQYRQGVINKLDESLVVEKPVVSTNPNADYTVNISEKSITANAEVDAFVKAKQAQGFVWNSQTGWTKPVTKTTGGLGGKRFPTTVYDPKGTGIKGPGVTGKPLSYELAKGVRRTTEGRKPDVNLPDVEGALVKKESLMADKLGDVGARTKKILAEKARREGAVVAAASAKLARMYSKAATKSNPALALFTLLPKETFDSMLDKSKLSNYYGKKPEA